MFNTIPTSRLIPIFTTRGDVGAFMIYPYLVNRQGEWVGWVASDRKVFSVHGKYVGYLSNDPRILRKVEDSFEEPDRNPPAPPAAIRLPPTIPLAPMMPELPQGVQDVLDEAPDLMASKDFGLKDLD